MSLIGLNKGLVPLSKQNIKKTDTSLKLQKETLISIQWIQETRLTTSNSQVVIIIIVNIWIMNTTLCKISLIRKHYDCSLSWSLIYNLLLSALFFPCCFFWGVFRSDGVDESRFESRFFRKDESIVWVSVSSLTSSCIKTLRVTLSACDTGASSVETGGGVDMEAGPRLNIKTVLSTYGDFHVKDKTAVRTSYL